MIESVSHDPWFNLALEEWLLRRVTPDEIVFYLWRNAPTVVIGRHQNPWVECRVDAMERDGVVLARRGSGGGAVFHDLGNTNFTFALHRSRYRVERQIGVVVDALGRLAIEAAFSGRNDIVVDGRKVSGSAFFGVGERWVHHGTLLIDADLGRLAHYLTVAPSKIRSKGVASVRARVANLVEFRAGLDHEQVCGALLAAFLAEYGAGATIERMDPTSMPDEPDLTRFVERYADPQWRFGKTPQFDHRAQTRFAWGGIDVHLDVVKGVVRAAKVYSDALDVRLAAALESALTGATYGAPSLAAAVESAAGRDAEIGASAREVAAWLREEFRDR